ncbi:gtr1/RagA G protein conserved region domain-containing protein [Trichoderma breve]|uniref:GTP-binding protein n=1 Tax=Trichoderma breve TaxID=2034170 RepID=A0A9W9BB41_9HYPO|nr:gtr1/RagA G protein conserved region domain-containing protein [Trichoderma breve]KAJ4859885.1 gtr1/RagA G protein conserved region domain-containing protein [Trichoderma breve]
MSLSPPIYGSPADKQLAELDALSRSPARSGVMSPARLKLQLLYEQNNRGPVLKGALKPADAAGGVPEKGKPRLLLMGQRRSGKSSISSVVFHKLAPNETLFLESTARIQKDTMASFMDFQVWDFPGQIDVFDNPSFDMEAIFGEIGALIWVIDAQDDYLEAVARLNITILSLQRTYPNINIEVFIHKVDGLSDDYKLDIQRDITIRIQDELSDHGFENAPVTFHLTSIYNHSIFEAFSKVIQKLIPRLGTLESMLTNLCRTCRFEKAYLFDVLSKIYIATDTATADMASYEICSDYIDVIIDITEIYGTWQRSDEGRKRLEAESCLVLHDSHKPIMLREVDRYLALVAIMTDDSYDRMPLVNMNVEAVVEGLTEFFDITKPKK